MDAKEFRSLQEAYNQVHQLDEVLDTPERANEYGKKVVKSVLDASAKSILTKDKKHLKTLDKRIKGAEMAKRKAERKAAEEVKESYDLYDIILSYLLDEGYAETPEAAEAIMVNMSEEWRQDIVEGVRPTPVDKPLDKADFKKRRRSLAGREASADARSRGHVDRLTGKPYGTEEAASRRKDIHKPEKAPEREARRRFAENPD